MFCPKSISLAKCNELDLIEITHIYGSDDFKNLLRRFNIDLKMRVRIKKKNKKIAILNNCNQTLLLSLDEASNIFGYNCNLKFKDELELKKKIILKSSLTIAITSLLFGFIFGYQKLTSIDFSLNTNSITLNYGEHFDANKFIKEINNGKVILPIIKDDTPGTYHLEYIAYNNFSSVTKQLTLNIIDDIPPTINLKTDSINSNDFTSCYDYIDSVNDNVDNFLHSKVKCSSKLSFNDNKAIITYEVTDSSNNSSKAFLTVYKE